MAVETVWKVTELHNNDINNNRKRLPETFCSFDYKPRRGEYSSSFLADSKIGSSYDRQQHVLELSGDSTAEQKVESCTSILSSDD